MKFSKKKDEANHATLPHHQLQPSDPELSPLTSSGHWPQRSAVKRYTPTAVFVAAFVVIGTLTLLLTHASTSTTPIIGKAGKCLDNYARRAVNGNKIELWTCNSTPAQQWKVNSNATITNVN